MSDNPIETIEKVADAAKSVAETTSHALTVAERATAWFGRLLGPDAAGILSDGLFYWRAKNALSLQGKLDTVLIERHIRNPKTMPLRLAIPFLLEATLEDDPTIQDRWARLLATAIDPDASVQVERCFGQVLSEMSALDCRVLESFAIQEPDSKGTRKAQALAETLNVSEKEVSVSLGNLRRLELVHNRYLHSGKSGQVPHGLTDFGEAFLMACSRGSQS